MPGAERRGETSPDQSGRSLSLPPEGVGIIHSMLFRLLRIGKARFIKAQVELSTQRSGVGVGV